MNIKTQGRIHSLKGELRDIVILSHENNNQVIAEYNGGKYTAIYNPVVGYYYVDDVYGEIKGGF